MNTKLLAAFICSIFLYACGSKQNEQGLGQAKVDGVETTLDEEPTSLKFTPHIIKQDVQVVGSDNAKVEFLGDKSTVSKKKIIKDGYISVKTNDINVSKKGIDKLLKTLNAYYESEDLQNNDQTISYDLKIRVPADNFENLISSIENGKDEIKSKSIQARDITEEYVDIETRLTNKREYLKRYKELLTKAATVKDIIAIEENIRTLQEEIESKEGRLKFLSDQVSFSTLNINIYHDKVFVYKPEPQDKFSERIKKSMSNGWTSIVGFVLWVISIWPFLFLVFAGNFVIKRILKKRKSSQA